MLIHHTDFIMVLPFHLGFLLSSVGLHSDSTTVLVGLVVALIKNIYLTLCSVCFLPGLSPHSLYMALTFSLTVLWYSFLGLRTVVYSELKGPSSVLVHAHTNECFLEMVKAHTAGRWINTRK